MSIVGNYISIRFFDRRRTASTDRSYVNILLISSSQLPPNGRTFKRNVDLPLIK